MATTGADPTFVDTNVLVYANVSTAPLHGAALALLTALYASGVALWTSRQVIREYLATLTRPQLFAIPSLATVVTDTQYIEGRFQAAEDNAAVTQELFALIKQNSVGP